MTLRPFRHTFNHIVPGWHLLGDVVLDQYGSVVTWVLHAEANGSTLIGTNHYVLRFERGQEPPARGFWSLVVHNQNCLPVDNRLHRFSIGDRDALRFHHDGSLEIYVGSVPPPHELESNWLPAPSASFHLLLSIHGPLPEVVRGDWNPPALARIGPTATWSPE